jgi:hypothetical protein
LISILSDISVHPENALWHEIYRSSMLPQLQAKLKPGNFSM